MHLPCAPKPYLLDPLLPSFCLADRAHQAPWEHRSGTTQAPMQPQSMRIHPCAHTQHSTLPPRPDTFRKTQAEKIKNLTNQGRKEGIVPRVVRSQASQDPPTLGLNPPGVNTAVHDEGRRDLAEAACPSHTETVTTNTLQTMFKGQGLGDIPGGNFEGASAGTVLAVSTVQTLIV